MSTELPVITTSASAAGTPRQTAPGRRYKMLLVNPTRTGGDSYITPPLHLIYVANAIIEAGHEARIIDLHYEYQKDPDRWPSIAAYERARFEEIVAEDMDFLGIGGIPSSYHCAKDLAVLCKQKRPEVPVIIGGNMSMPLVELWHKAGVDFLVESDGELPIKRFLAAWPDRGQLAAVPGLYLREAEGYCSTKPELPKVLDHISSPDWGLLEHFDDYLDIFRNWTNRILPPNLQLRPTERIIPIVMTRGCPYQCTFCYHVTNRYRKHSIEYVVNYLKHLKREYGITHIFTWDDLIMVDRHWLADLCDAIVHENLGLRIFTSGGKPDLVTREVLQKMKQAGFLRVSYGIESGSQEILDIMKKRATVEQNHNSVLMATKEGLFVHLNMIVGMPGESYRTLRDTSAFLTKLAKNGVVSSKNLSFSFATGYPGTELYDLMLRQGMVTDTEDYLRNQAGLGNYKYNLCGIPQKILKLIINLTFVRVDWNYHMHSRNYLGAARSSIYGLAKSVLTLALPPRALVALRNILLRHQLTKGGAVNAGGKPTLANAS